MADLSIQTPEDFARQLLAGIGAPVTDRNVATVTQWEKHEGGHWQNSAKFNPLNTTLAVPGSGTMNSVGVRVYSSWAEGLKATIDTLLGRSWSSGTVSPARADRYDEIVNDLRANLPAADVAADVRASPWGTKFWTPAGTPSSSPAPSSGFQFPTTRPGQTAGDFVERAPGSTQGNTDLAKGLVTAPVDIATSAARSVLGWIAKPLELVALVGIGLIIIVVGLVVLAKAAGNTVNVTPAPAGGKSESGGGGEAVEAAAV